MRDEWGSWNEMNIGELQSRSTSPSHRALVEYPLAVIMALIVVLGAYLLDLQGCRGRTGLPRADVTIAGR